MNGLYYYRLFFVFFLFLLQLLTSWSWFGFPSILNPVFFSRPGLEAGAHAGAEKFDYLLCLNIHLIKHWWGFNIQTQNNLCCCPCIVLNIRIILLNPWRDGSGTVNLLGCGKLEGSGTAITIRIMVERIANI